MRFARCDNPPSSPGSRSDTFPKGAGTGDEPPFDLLWRRP